MIGFLVRRFFQAIIVVLGVLLIVFLLAQLIPGGEARAVLGTKATPRSIHHFDVLNGFTLPLWDQFYQYLYRLVHLNLGYSYTYNQGVWTLIANQLPKTLVLVGFSTLIALVIAIPLGILQVVRRNKPVDYVLTGLAFVFYAMPAFLLGTLLILYFAIDFHWFPVGLSQSQTVGNILSDPRALVLPELTLAALTIASFSRYMRSSMMEAMTEDYVRTATRQGRGAPARPLRPRPAQRPDPDPDPARAVDPRHRQRRRDHRDGVQLPGHGVPHGGGGGQDRHSGAPRHDTRRHDRHRGRLPARRHRCTRWPTRGSVMPGDALVPGDHELRDPSGSPWSSEVVAEEAIPGLAIPPADPLLRPTGPEGGDVATSGRGAAPDRPRLPGKQARRRRAWRSSSSWSCSASSAHSCTARTS